MDTIPPVAKAALSDAISDVVLKQSVALCGSSSRTFFAPYLASSNCERNMSTESVSSGPATRATKQMELHPLAPLTADEITTAAAIVRGVWPEKTDLHFKVITLQEPPKSEVVPYLEAEHEGGQLPTIGRKAFVNYYLRNTV